RPWRSRQPIAPGQRTGRHARAACSCRRLPGHPAHHGPRLVGARPGTRRGRPMTPVRIALADDQALVRHGLRVLLASLGIEVAVECEDGQELLDALAIQQVDVVVSDVRMPRLDGIAALQQLRARGDATPVVLLTTFDDSALLLRAVEAGAQGFLLKDASPEDLRDAIVAVAAGRALLQPVSIEPVRERF